MKKIIHNTLLTILLSLGIQSAFANPQETELGRGFFYVGETNPVSLSLDKLATKNTYDIICVVKALDANNFPVKLGFYVDDNGGMSAWEKTFNDEHESAIFFSHVNINKPSVAKLIIKVLEGKGTANPVEYNCYAEDRG